MTLANASYSERNLNIISLNSEGIDIRIKNSPSVLSTSQKSVLTFSNLYVISCT